MKKVSIIVPIYNVEKYLDRCVQSIINQTYGNIQIILVDDGSPDKCPEMCDIYADMDSRVTVIHKENGGLGYARNSGMEKAIGDYIVFVDSDDYIPNDYVETLVESIEKYNVDVCISGYNKVKPDGTISYSVVYDSQLYDGNVKEMLLPRIFGSRPKMNDSIHPSVCGLIYKLDSIKLNGMKFMSERDIVSEDLVFEIELFSRVNSVMTISKSMYNYCDNENTLSSTFNIIKLEKQEQLYEYICKKIAEKKLPQEVKVRFQKLFMIYIKEDIRMVSEMNMGRKEKNMLIKKIVESNTVRNILDEYPVREMALSKRIYMLLVKYKRYILLKYLVRVR